MNANLEIRRILAEEWPIFKRVRLAALKEAPYAFCSTYEQALQRNDKAWQDFVEGSAAGDGRATIFALSDGQPIGMGTVSVDREEEGTSEITQVWVDPNNRRRGVSRLVLKAMASWSKELSQTLLVAWIREGNESSKRFFLKEGFQRTEREDNFGCNEYRAFRYERNV